MIRNLEKGEIKNLYVILIYKRSTMGLFNFFGKPNAQEPKKQMIATGASDENKIKLMQTLTKNLSAYNFTQKEIQEVFNIIENAEADILLLKANLNEIKQSSETPTVAILKIKKEVEMIQQKMAADIKTKVRQIKLRKQKVKKQAL
jgi:uncharacterized membrane protein